VESNSFRSKKQSIVNSLEFQFLSVKEVSIILVTTSKTVREFISQGKLRAFQVGGSNRLTRISVKDLEKFIDEEHGDHHGVDDS